MKRSLLIEEPPLQILPSLAAAIGLNEAIVLQQLYWLLQQPNNGKEVNGHKWIFNTMEQWRDSYFPFWSVDTIQRAFESLHSKFIVESCQPEGRASRRKFYRVNFGALEKLNFEQLAEDRKLRLSEKRRHPKAASCHDRTPQVAVIEEGKLPPSLVTKTSSENSSKTSIGEKSLNTQIQTLKTTPPSSPNCARPSSPAWAPEWHEVAEFADEKNWTREKAAEFFNYYDALGWEWKGSKIKNWRAKAQSWFNRWMQEKKIKNQAPHTAI